MLNNLKRLQNNWEKLAQTDPLWAILVNPHKKGGRWSLDEFFAKGTKEICEIMNCLEIHNIEFNKRRALDFGCGVGRLTQALSTNFEQVTGVDISNEMIELAIKLNKIDNCKFILNSSKDLLHFNPNSYDFIYSNLVLHHMHPRLALNYLAEFMRILEPQGVLVFQVFDGFENNSLDVIRNNPLSDYVLYPIYLLFKFGFKPRMETYALKEKRITTLMTKLGATFLLKFQNTDVDKKWRSFTYVFRK